MKKPNSYTVWGEFSDISVAACPEAPDGEDYYATFEEAKQAAIKLFKETITEYQDGLERLEQLTGTEAIAESQEIL